MGRIQHLLGTLIISLYSFKAHMLQPPPYFTLGGLFDTYFKNADSTVIRLDAGSQYLAAFVMAIDEINNKSDGVHDNLLPFTKIKLMCEIGVSMVSLYPPNNFVNGAARAYILRMKDLSMVAAVDGSSIDESTSANAQTLNNWGVLDMISRSTSGDYAHPETFPLTLQNTPSQIAEANLLVKLVGQKFRWQYVAVFFIYDTKAGLDATVAFQGNLGNDGVGLLGSYPIKTGQTNFDYPISQAIDSGATIFAFFLDGSTAGRLLEQGYNAGLFHDGTQVLATSTANIDDIRKSFTTAGRLNEANILKGFLSTAPHPEYHFSTPQGQSFVSRYRKLPPTVVVDPITKIESCNTRNIIGIDGSYNNTKGRGKMEFKQIAANQCLGFESFETFFQNGSNIDAAIMYTYDSVIAYLLTADGLINRGLTLTAPNLYESMSTTFFIPFVTGPAFFIPGRGTRIVGNVLKLVNYQASAAINEYSDGNLAFVGEYTDSTGWLLCSSAGESVMTPYSQSMCSPPLYRNNPMTASPSDAPPPLTEGLPSKFSLLLIVFASFGLCTLAVWGIFIFVYWRSKQIRVAQPKLMSFLLLGGALGLIKVLLSAGTINQASCITQLWFSHYSFRLIFRTLLLKLWRIDKVVNASSFKRIIVSENQVLLYLLLDIVLVTIFLLIPITAISCNSMGMVGYISTTRNNQTTLYVECQVIYLFPFLFPSLTVHLSCGCLQLLHFLELIHQIFYPSLTHSSPVFYP